MSLTGFFLEFDKSACLPRASVVTKSPQKTWTLGLSHKDDQPEGVSILGKLLLEENIACRRSRQFPLTHGESLLGGRGLRLG